MQLSSETATAAEDKATFLHHAPCKQKERREHCSKGGFKAKSSPPEQRTRKPRAA